MKKIKLSKVIFPLAISFIASSIFAQPSTTPLWTKTYNGTGGTNCTNGTAGVNDYGRAVTTDGSGNVYVTGGANAAITSNKYIQTIKYSPTGTVLWSTRVCYTTSGTCTLEEGYSIAVDGSGNVWVAGTTFKSGVNSELTLIKFNSSGTVQSHYPKTYGSGCSASTGTPIGSCIAISGTSVYVGGSLYNSSAWAFVVLKDNPNTTGWAWQYVGQGSATANEHRVTDIKVNPTNTYVYATGFVSNATSNGKDCFTVGLDASTGLIPTGTSWPVIYNNATYTLDDVPNAISIISGDICIAGYTTKTSDKDALLIKYNSSGVQQWVKTYDATGANGDSWSDIETLKNTSGTPTIFVGGYSTKGTNTNYALAAYDGAGNLATSYWTLGDPVTYDGGASNEPLGTDKGYGIEYSATTNRVYITGTASEGTSSTYSVSISTIGYNATTGVLEWGPAIYDESSTEVAGGIDENYWKYGFKTYYSGCYAQDILSVEGAGQFNNGGTVTFDYVTLNYGSSGPCTAGPSIGGRAMNNNNHQENIAAELHPNPFSTTAGLRLNPGTQIMDAVLSIYDVTGRVVASVQNISSTTIVIDRGPLQNGLYFFTLSENGNMISNGKFLIAD